MIFLSLTVSTYCEREYKRHTGNMGFRHIESMIFSPNLISFDKITFYSDMVTAVDNGYKFASPTDIVTINNAMNNYTFETAHINDKLYDNLLFVKIVDFSGRDGTYEYTVEDNPKTIGYSAQAPMSLKNMGVLSVYDLSSRKTINPTVYDNNKIMLFRINSLDRVEHTQQVTMTITVLALIETAINYYV